MIAGAGAAPGCPELMALLAAETDDGEKARRVAANSATCPACAAAEGAPTALLVRYRRGAEPPLSPEHERRLRERFLALPPG